MTIEFQCTECDKVLRTTDDKAGRTATCPNCETVLTVPSSIKEEQGYESSTSQQSSFLSGQINCPMCGEKQDKQSSHCSSCGESLAPQQNSRHSGTEKEKASFWIRFGAYIIDMIIINVMSFALGIVVGFVLVAMGERVLGPGIRTALNIMGFVVGIFYFALMESSSNQATVGKMAVGIMVTDTNGHRISFGNALGRYLGKIISGLVCALGFIWAAFDEQSQTWHDKMAGTFVVKKD